jgi:hypothetical protein
MRSDQASPSQRRRAGQVAPLLGEEAQVFQQVAEDAGVVIIWPKGAGEGDALLEVRLGLRVAALQEGHAAVVEQRGRDGPWVAERPGQGQRFIYPGGVGGGVALEVGHVAGGDQREGAQA